MDIISTVSMININETLVVQVASFLVFLFLINRVMFKPLCNTIADRRDYVGRLKSDIDQAREKIDDIEETIRRQEAEVRREAAHQVVRLEEEGSHRAEEIFAAAREEISEMSRRIQEEVAARLAEARKAAQKEAESVARGIIAKILDRSQQS